MEASVVRGTPRAAVWRERLSTGLADVLETLVNPSFPLEAWDWWEATLSPALLRQNELWLGAVSVFLPFFAEGREGSLGDP